MALEYLGLVGGVVFMCLSTADEQFADVAVPIIVKQQFGAVFAQDAAHCTIGMGLQGQSPLGVVTVVGGLAGRVGKLAELSACGVDKLQGLASGVLVAEK